ncbi:Tautomerase/MIF [Coprinopsis marcescibilis]|uniref:L-dopachrome isomerase n=1 Tax=Coprinopsis marcescibilis TaxID=230819 RepID=A0A5C3L060_COPMA|nr:Tautomerase/MIF [Coprinopsis marcescibilis]
MPALELITNVKIADEKAFVVEFSKLGAELLSKPEKYISINVRHNPTLTFGGTFDPAFILSIVSLDNINPEVNEKYSKALFKFFEDKLGVPGDRGYVVFNDPGRAYIGYEGTTFATIFGK